MTLVITFFVLLALWGLTLRPAGRELAGQPSKWGLLPFMVMTPTLFLFVVFCFIRGLVA